jgi:membrane fusion protein (multidrug efflux system)
VTASRRDHDLPHGRRTARVPLFGAALLAAVLAACGGDAGEEGGPRATDVEAAVARLDTLAVNVEAVGSLEARARVEVKPEAAGRVTDILFEEGEEVEDGEVLLRLDQNKLRAELQAAQAAVMRAEAEFENFRRQVERNDSLLAQGAISQQAYDDLQTQFASARARLEEARANRALRREDLEDATIRAPFDGRVGAREIDLGDFVSVGAPLFTVVDDDPLEIQFSVPERHLGRLHAGSPVEVTVQSMPDRTFRGEVDFVSPYVEPASRSVALKARIPNPAAELTAGQFANVLLQLERRPAVVVPEAAILARQTGSFVFVAEDGQAFLREVQTGLRRGGMVELRSGVAEGDTVIVAGYQRLSDGSAVSVTAADGAGFDGSPEGAAPGSSAESPADTGADPASERG